MHKSLNRTVQFAFSGLKFYKSLMFCAVLLLGCLITQAQTIFPVQSTTRILPPYSVYLADYAVNGNDKLQCILVNRDATQQTYQVRLRLTVKLNGRVILQTSSAYNPSPITLTPNMAMVFAGATLEPYLKSENLDFVGYSQEQYESSRALPEGFYEIGFAAYDYYRQDVQVSNDGWGFYFLAKNEPPLINMPSCGSKLQTQYSTPIRFSWLPRNTASLNSSNTTIYRYFLYEVNPQGTNPNDIVNSLPPIYVDSTPINQSFYDLMPTTTLLRDEYVYAWRVQAVDVNGADLFRNNGFSEVCTFTWGGPGSNPYGSIDSVLNLNAIGETERKGKMWWTKDLVKFDGYKVYYKKAGNGYNWFTSETENDTLRVLDLEPDTEYECRIQGRKNGNFGMYSEVRYFRTKKIIPVDCSDLTEVPIVTNGRPLLQLTPGMILTYRDFPVIAMDSIVALGQPGHFAGKGAVSIPFLAYLPFAVTFDDITVDDAGVISNGVVEFVTKDIMTWWEDHREEQEGGNEAGDVVTGNDAANYTAPYNINGPGSIQPQMPLVNGVTNIIITRPDGTRDTIKNVPLPYTIKDVDGDLYSVDQNGTVTHIGQSGGLTGLNPATLNQIELGKAKVTFKPHPSQVYAFDAWQSIFAGKPFIEKEYEKLTDAGTDYYVPNKAIVSAKTDKVIAKIEITDNNYKVDSIKFATGQGTVFKPAPTSIAGEYDLTIIGGPGNDAQELYALYPKTGGGYTTIGKLKIPSYNEVVKSVVLVPVNGDQVDQNAIQDYLNSVYNPINVKINVEVDEPFTNMDWDLNKDGMMDISGSGLLSKYTAEMKRLYRDYKNQRPIEENKSYIFILKESNETGVEGDMPMKTKYGYLFTKPLKALTSSSYRIGRAVAHELGHGQFVLRHTFDVQVGLPARTTDNLMDNTSASTDVTVTAKLYKFQWDGVHDPATIADVWEDDANSYTTSSMELIEADAEGLSEPLIVQPTGTYLSPAGKPVMLPTADTKNLQFLLCNNINMTRWPVGSLIRFIYKDTAYTALVTKASSSQTFFGYAKEIDYAAYLSLPAEKRSIKDNYPPVYTYTKVKGVGEKVVCYSEFLNLQDYTKIKGVTFDFRITDAAQGGYAAEGVPATFNVYTDYEFKSQSDKDGASTPCSQRYLAALNGMEVGLGRPEHAPGTTFYDDHLRQNNPELNRVIENIAKLLSDMGTTVYDKYLDKVTTQPLRPNESLMKEYIDFYMALKQWSLLLKDFGVEASQLGNPEAMLDFYWSKRTDFSSDKTIFNQWAVKDRLAVIRKLATGPLRDAANFFSYAGKEIFGANGYGGENFVIDLITTTPDKDRLEMMNGLAEGDLLYKLVKKLDDEGLGGSNFSALNEWILKSFDQKIKNEQYDINTFTQQNRVFYWKTEFFGSAPKFDARINSSGKINVKFQTVSTDNINQEVNNFVDNVLSPPSPVIGPGSYPFDKIRNKAVETNVTLNPFDPVVIVMNDQLPGDLDYFKDKGGIVIVPAITLDYAWRKDRTARINRGVNVAVNVGSIFIGVGVFKNAATLGKIIAAADIALSASDILISDPYVLKQLQSTEAGKKFLKTFYILQASLAVADLTTSLTGLQKNAQDFVDSYSDIKRTSNVLAEGTEADKKAKSLFNTFMQLGILPKAENMLVAIEQQLTTLVNKFSNVVTGTVHKATQNGKVALIQTISAVQTKVVEIGADLKVFREKLVVIPQLVSVRFEKFLNKVSGYEPALANGSLKDYYIMRINEKINNAQNSIEQIRAATREEIVDIFKWKMGQINNFAFNDVNFKRIIDNLMSRGDLGLQQMDELIEYIKNAPAGSKLGENLIKDLNNSSRREDLIKLLSDNPKDIDIYRRLKDDPYYYYELKGVDFASTSDKAAWQRWGNSEFFKQVTALGQKFEKEVVLVALRKKVPPSAAYTNLKTKVNTEFGVNLDEYEMFSQVQLKYNDAGDYFVADQIYVKFGTNGLGQPVPVDMIVIENKLKSSTLPTTPQSQALQKTSYEVRSLAKAGETNTAAKLEQGFNLNFQGSKKWVKVYDSDTGDAISGMERMQ